MWSDAEREDGMWSDAERATDILKRSCRPLLSFFLSSFFLPHPTTCLSPFSNRSILPQPLFSCPVSAAAARRSCPCPVSATTARRPCPVRSCPRPPPRAIPVLSDPVRSCPVRSCPRPPLRADLVLVPLPKALSARPLHFVASTTLRVANDPLCGTTIVTQDVFRQCRDAFRQCRDAFRQC